MYVNYSHLLLWFLILVILVIIEILTINLVVIWFIIGSIFAFFSVFLTENFNYQFIVFVLFALISIVFTKNNLNYFLNLKKTATNADSLIGQTCLVTEEINNLFNIGKVIVGENVWSALSKDENIVIKLGAKVKILEIRGVKVIVEEI